MSSVYRVFRMVSPLLLAGTLAACAQLGGVQNASGGREQLLLRQMPTAEYLSEPQSLWVGGEVASLYVNKAGRLAFDLGAASQLLDEGAPVRGGKFLTLRQQGGTLYALWWSHQNAKALYFRASRDGGKTFAPVQIVNTGDGVLPPYEFVADESGVLGAVYTDEREPGYQIYFNRTDASGKKWQEKDVRLDKAQAVSMMEGKDGPQASEPHLARLGQNLVVTWQEVVKDGGKLLQRVVSRASADMGQSWQKEVEIYRGEHVPAAFHMVVVGQQIVLAGDLSNAGVQAWRTPDAGRSWQAMGALPGSAAFINSQLALTSQGNRVYAVYSAEKVEEKSQIHAGVLDLAQGKWQGAVTRLDAKAFDLSKSVSPDIAALPGGGAVAVWQDFRNIRPNVYMSQASADGASWTPAVAVQPDEGRYGALTPRVAVQDGRVAVFYQRFVNDGNTSTDYTQSTLKYDAATGRLDAGPAEAKVSAEEKKNRLSERVEGFWSTRVNGKYANTYEYFDPAYRSTTSKEAFDKFQGNLKYHSFQVEKLDILGNIARVNMKVNFEVLETVVMGQTFSRPPTDSFMTNEWVWMYDNWYLVNQTALGNRALNY